KQWGTGLPRAERRAAPSRPASPRGIGRCTHRTRGRHFSMIDFGFDKIALIGAVALIVLGPERLPRVARTVGHLLGKAQRYVADVKAEVNRSVELEDLKKMKTQFEDAARTVEQSVSNEIHS